jgi:Winged helix-turn-helix DNA-binding
VTVLDQFRQAERALAQRMRELRPLADEYRELEQIAQQRGLRIDDDQTTQVQTEPATSRRRRSRARSQAASSAATATKNATPSARPTRQRRATPTARSAKRQPGTGRGGNRREDILRLVSQRPGITVAEIGSELRIDPTGLYRPVRQLQQQGAITKDGTKLTSANNS